ncbi:PREDICTED: putative defensin-like protein 244 [Camelina sativa]|uniref:Defensin-like protein 244 n=1 Tax=Camelina sativa TaxID=90675 RepID=A0ABM1QN34_CAMSA|nr:PREDICTED: putative defensin-like protein 244 [Camelina sativa]
MKCVAILLVSCLLFSLLSANLAEGLEWCPSKDVFRGSCTDRGSPSYTCFLDLLGSKSASAMPKNCKCTPLPHNRRQCDCFVVCNN